MAGYQVTLVERPDGWEPRCPDDAPPQPKERLEVLDDFDDFFAAVRKAIQHNETAAATSGGRWAVVVEPESAGRLRRDARLCTPVAYKVATIEWPEGWEPGSPSDVPNCVFRIEGADSAEPTTYQRAKTIVSGLNRQCIDNAETSWHVVVAVENEPVSQDVSYDPSGTETTVEVRSVHVIRLESGGRGDCSHCPAHAFDCAKADWQSQRHTVTAKRIADRRD